MADALVLLRWRDYPRRMKADFDQTQFRQSALREGLSLLGHAVLFPFGYIQSRHQTRRAEDMRTVVLVHGLGANRSVFYPMQGYLKLKGHHQQLSLNLPMGPSIESLAVMLQQEIDAKVKGGRIDIIAHSLGGLVARTYIQLLDGARRVDRLITLGTPHYGTHAAHFVPSAFVRQLKPDSSFLSDLNARPFPQQVACTSFAGGQDALILPQESALLAQSHQILMPKSGHNELLMSPRVFAHIHQQLASSPNASSPMTDSTKQSQPSL